MYGRYHLTQPLAFYNATNAWNVSPERGGRVARPGPARDVHDQRAGQHRRPPARCNGWRRCTSSSRCPGSRRSRSTWSTRSCPSPRAIRSRPCRLHHGRIDPGSTASSPCSRHPAHRRPRPGRRRHLGHPAKISQRSACSTRRARASCSATLQVVPVGDSMLYFRPFYVESSRNPFPQARVLHRRLQRAHGPEPGGLRHDPAGWRSDLFQVALPTPGSGSSDPPTGPATVSHVQTLIAQANTDFQQAQTDLKAGNFAAYGTDITNLQGVLQQLQQAPRAVRAPPRPRRRSHDDDHDQLDDHDRAPNGVALRRSTGGQPGPTAGRNRPSGPGGNLWQRRGVEQSGSSSGS